MAKSVAAVMYDDGEAIKFRWVCPCGKEGWHSSDLNYRGSTCNQCGATVLFPGILSRLIWRLLLVVGLKKGCGRVSGTSQRVGCGKVAWFLAPGWGWDWVNIGGDKQYRVLHCKECLRPAQYEKPSQQVVASVESAIADLFSTEQVEPGITRSMQAYTLIDSSLKRYGVELPQGLLDRLSSLPDGKKIRPIIDEGSVIDHIECPLDCGDIRRRATHLLEQKG